MSLVRLLTTGKSLVGGEEATSRYRLPRQNWLPKFGSVKNPFASTVTADPARVSGQTPASDAAQTPAPSAALKKTQRLPRHQLPARVASDGGAVSRGAGSAKYAGKWLSALNPFSSKGGAKSKPAAGARSALPVQGELSLDKVKVVRNDLHDADLEVVPLRSATGKVAAGVEAVIAAKAVTGAGALDRPAVGLRALEREQAG